MNSLRSWLVRQGLRSATESDVACAAATSDVEVLLRAAESTTTAVRRRAVRELASADGPRVEDALRRALYDRARSVADAAAQAIERGHPSLGPEWHAARTARQALDPEPQTPRPGEPDTFVIGPDKVGRNRSSRRKVLDRTQSRGHYGSGF